MVAAAAGVSHLRLLPVTNVVELIWLSFYLEHTLSLSRTPGPREGGEEVNFIQVSDGSLADSLAVNGQITLSPTSDCE